MFSVLFIFTACEKEESTVSSALKKDATSEKFKVVDGVLHIGDSANYRKNTLDIMKLPEPEFREWERSLGFKSLRSWIREANDAMDRTTNIDELAFWKEKYGDILEIGETEIKPYIEDIFAQCFANRNGNFIVGNYYAKAVSGKTILLRDGSEVEILKYLNKTKSEYEKGIIVDNYEKQYSLRNGCPNLEVWRKYFDKGVLFRFAIARRSDYFSPAYKYTLIRIDLIAKRKNWLGKWKDGTADLKWMESEWRVTDNNGVQWGVGYPAINAGQVGNHSTLKLETLIDCNDDQYYTDYVKPAFDYKKAKGTSNYLDWNKYAVHCCGFPSTECPAADG